MITDELKNYRSFNDRALVLGIPSKLFGGAVGMSIILVVMISFPFGLAFLVATVVPLYALHKDDPEAANLYLSEFLSADKYVHDLKKPMAIRFLDNDYAVSTFETIQIKENPNV
ncbi:MULTISPECIES: hypothetical protein [unclassified Pseudoalteromonas]|uniref:hypothetical protein n=1 Tax=unclassified Pseudoalteromonas TaxID=194690 RepID=UPI001F1B0744|nr:MULTISPECIES: hypothetical protein [unclassified Pseudoalteromonas]MCF2829700.1 hypothetical protein [Pseudoalteromonas sp. OF5H-5]MCF2832616.1 hypothetical protein [Pseudoalteromonas sp. DL2-H6]MCF2927590.1 hypothetical protein [Pseudoalteromonas sp. DL2-H1]